MKDVTQPYPLRFKTVQEGTDFIETYRALKTKPYPFIYGLQPFTRKNERAMVNPDYKNAGCEIRIFEDEGQRFATVVKL